MRPGIEPGEACIREVAAYLCDRGHFLGVPATTLVEARHPAFCYNVGPEKVKVYTLILLLCTTAAAFEVF
jgi:hypothetical protein